MLGHYVREERVLDLPTAIHRMTGMPAAKFQLADRGEIRAGRLRRPRGLRPGHASPTPPPTRTPSRFPAGIRAVYVNGTRVADSGAHTGARPGRTLRRNKS